MRKLSPLNRSMIIGDYKAPDLFVVSVDDAFNGGFWFWRICFADAVPPPQCPEIRYSVRLSECRYRCPENRIPEVPL